MPQNSTALHHLTTEYKPNPLGLDARTPRLSWQLRDERRGITQTAYQIQAASTREALLDDDLLWDSARVDGGQSLHVPYGGPPLASRQRVWWRVRAWTNRDDEPSAWSEPAWFEMGLLEADDWRAEWIAPPADDPSTSQPCPLLRTEFTAQGDVVSARLYVTALGLYEAQLNGKRVGDQLLTPGWTSYHSRVQYQTYDVTELVQSGENAIGITLGDGWYRGFIGFHDQRNFYGERLALRLQLHVDFADGRTQLITGNADDWRATTGPILASDIYNGETYDARLERDGWAAPGYDDSDWETVEALEPPAIDIVAPEGPPVRRTQELAPVAVIEAPNGETLIDFGQNLVGWVKLRLPDGPEDSPVRAGDTITLRHGEVLDGDGNLYTENLRTARQTVKYICRGEGEEVYEPHFTFQGFRYISVEGWPSRLTSDNVGDALTAVVVHSDMQQTGTFDCSNELLNQLQHNIEWGQRGNFVDVPTDCPQRDERMGWTGDAQVFIRTAAFNFNVAGFFTKWLRDLAAEQPGEGSAAGAVPHVVPNVLNRFASDALLAANEFRGFGSAAWGDAATICPWTIYLCYGDKALLERQYASMKGWVDFIAAQAGDNLLWESGFHFGDWLAIQLGDDRRPDSVTSMALIATAFFAHSTQLVARAAAVLGKREDAAKYGAQFEQIRDAFGDEFVSPNGRVDAGTQTAYVLALHFDLLPEQQRARAVQRLVDDIRERGDHLSTGFVGTPYLCHVLSENSHLDVAYDLLLQEEYPSWLYPVKLGATTIWERWDGIRPDGTFQNVGMNSFNHYAYGAIGDWMYQVVAGIELEAGADFATPGYQHVRIQPQPGGELTYARASLDSLYGAIASAWEQTEEGFVLRVEIPANTRATVQIPNAQVEQVREGEIAVGEADGVERVEQAGEAVLVEVGSGAYRFSV